MKRRSIYTAVLLGIIVMLSVGGNAKGKKELVDDGLKRKSQYVFMEAMRKKSIGEYADYVALLRHAYSLDTTNTAIAYHLGYNALISENATEGSIAWAMQMMRKHFDSVPENFNESFFYGSICGKLRKHDEALRVWTKLAELYPAKLQVKYRLADAYASMGNYAAAITLYDSIEAKEGMSELITVRKVNYHFASKDTINSIAEARKLLDSAPGNVDYNLLLGNVYMQFAQGDSAIAYFDKAHEIEPENGYVYLYKADYYKAQGDSVNYDKQIYNVLINDNLNISQKAEILTDYVRNEFAGGVQKSERIDNLFATLIEQHPHEVIVHDLYSEYLVTIHEYEQAIEQLDYVAYLEPVNAENWKKLMLLNLMTERYDEAFKASDKSLEYNPNNIELYQYIAPAYMQVEEYDKAIEMYNVALSKADSTDYELLSNLASGMGDVYYAQGDTAKVLYHYEQALRYNPGNIMAMNNYAYYLAELNKELDKAEKLSATTVKYEPENPTFLDTYAWIFFKKGEYGLALTYMKAAMANSEKEEPSAVLYEHYGDILFMNGQPDEAVSYWEKALELSPESELLQRKVKHKTFFFK